MRFVLVLFVVALASCRSSAGAKTVDRPKSVKQAKGLSSAPLISRGRPVETSKRMSGAKHLVDGRYKADVWQVGKPSADKPEWAAIDIGAGPTRVMLSWTSSGCFNHRETTYGGPGSYRIETSGDSTDGEGGTWKVVADVKDNDVRARSHAFDFTGQRWVRFSVLGPSPNTYEYGVQIDEIDVHDVSAGADDTWFFLGDSITAMAFNRQKEQQPSFAELIAKKHPGTFPLQINGGIGGEKTDEGLLRLPGLLKDNPDVHFWAIAYGSNDSAGDNPNTQYFEKNLDALITQIKKAGRVPVVARIPFAVDGHATVPAFNEVIDALVAKHALPKGPDLYPHFKAHPEELSDGLHPNDKGAVSINRLWAEAVDPLY